MRTDKLFKSIMTGLYQAIEKHNDTYYQDIEKTLDTVYCMKLQSQVGLWFVNQITGEVERLVSVSGVPGNPATFRRPNGQLERGYLTDYLQD